MTDHPGRLTHLSMYAYDTTLTDDLRATHLRLAFPNGYDTTLALPEIGRARQLRDAGNGAAAALVLAALVNHPPTGEQP